MLVIVPIVRVEGAIICLRLESKVRGNKSNGIVRHCLYSSI